MKLDGKSETLVRWMDRVACTIQFLSYCVHTNLITRVKSMCGELRHLLHKWHHQKKKKGRKQSSAVFKICGSQLRDSYECDLETQSQLLGWMRPSE